MARVLFLDTETTGLLDSDGVAREARLLEVGMVVVETPTFEIVAEQSHVFHFPLKPALTKDHHFLTPGGETIFIHPNVVKMHQANGLWEACKRSQLNDYTKLDALVGTFIMEQAVNSSVLAGAGVDFDRAIMRKYLPQALGKLHYRNFDTNALWLLQSFLTGQEPARDKGSSHRAIDDCKEAIAQVEKHFDFFCQLVKETSDG